MKRPKLPVKPIARNPFSTNAACSAGVNPCGSAGDSAGAPELLEQELSELGIDLQLSPTPKEGEALAETPGYTTVDVVVGYGAQARAVAGQPYSR